MSEDTQRQLKNDCLNLLSMRELSRLQLQQRLNKAGHEQQDIEQVLDELAAEGWQSDERFTEQYVAMRLRKGFGPYRIEQELEQRGISGAFVNEEIGACDWRIAIAEVYRKKFANSAIDSWKERTKRMRFLQYRGFSAELIQRFMRTVDDDSAFNHPDNNTDEFG